MIEEKIKEFKKDKILKTGLYIGVGILSLYLLSKTFNSVASTIRAFNNLKSALNGN
jgi:hypothetical protein